MTSTRDIMKRVSEQYSSDVPNLTTLGYFESKLQAIVLSSVTRSDFELACSTDDPVARVRVHPLLAHELRHWLDYVGTLWGQRQLNALFNGLNARANDDPKHFAPIVTYFRSLKKTFLVDYFTTITKDLSVLADRRRWQSHRTCGFRFEADGSMSQQRRILFVRFTTAEGSDVSRTPLSVASLLETGAMYAELDADIAVLKTVPEEDRTHFEQDYIAPRHCFYYDPQMTAYSVAAHLAANILDLYDAPSCYALAASLAHVCLNLPQDLYKDMRPPKAFEAFGEAHTDLVNEGDPAFAFQSLLCHIAESRESATNADSSELDAFVRAGLPPRVELERHILHEMQNLRNEMVAGPFSDYRLALLDYGLLVFQSRGLFGNKLYPLQAIIEARFIPPIMLADFGPFTLSQEVDIWKDCEPRWNATGHLLSKMEEFYRICGV